MGYLNFGQVINRVGKIADFGYKQGKGFGKHTPIQFFWEYPPPPPGDGDNHFCWMIASVSTTYAP